MNEQDGVLEYDGKLQDPELVDYSYLNPATFLVPKTLCLDSSPLD